MNSYPMLPITQLIKKYWIYVFFLFAAGWSGHTFLQRKHAQCCAINITAKTFQTSGGWGYNVYRNGALFIHQEHMPALEGRKGFATEAQASQTAHLVMSKMKGTGLPVVSKAEVVNIIGR